MLLSPTPGLGKSLPSNRTDRKKRTKGHVGHGVLKADGDEHGNGEPHANLGEGSPEENAPCETKDANPRHAYLKTHTSLKTPKQIWGMGNMPTSAEASANCGQNMRAPELISKSLFKWLRFEAPCGGFGGKRIKWIPCVPLPTPPFHQAGPGRFPGFGYRTQARVSNLFVCNQHPVAWPEMGLYGTWHGQLVVHSLL